MGIARELVDQAEIKLLLASEMLTHPAGRRQCVPEGLRSESVNY